MINLERSVDRRRFQERQLERVGLEHEFVPGVDGRELEPSENTLMPGVVGCALGHIAAYRRVAEDNAHAAVVLEDDAILPDNVNEILDSIDPHMQGADVVLLHYRAQTQCPLSTHETTDLGGGYRLHHPVRTRPLSAATAYVITPEACRRMVEFLFPIRFWADYWDAFLQGGAIDRVRCIVPRPIEAEADFKSTLGYREGLVARVIPAGIRARRRHWLQRRFSDFPLVSDPPQSAPSS